ncbi:MAG: DUF3237 domain-containing protein [Clostridia bacterium]|nr:DUF3237 domain-containing protein [Clostridia bacterium]
MELTGERVMSLLVKVGESKRVGQTPEGELTIIPITGGTFEGAGIKGKVCPGGADWNTKVSEEIAHVFAKYWIETDDGEIISIENEGYINLKRGDAKIRTTPKFLCDMNGKYAYLAMDTYAGELKAASKDCVEVTIYRIK